MVSWWGLEALELMKGPIRGNTAIQAEIGITLGIGRNKYLNTRTIGN